MQLITVWKGKSSFYRRKE